MALLANGLRLSDLSSMPAEERVQRVDELFRAALEPTSAQVQEQLNELNNQIRYFESKYGLSSQDMIERLERGLIQENTDTCAWMMLLRTKSRFYARQSKAQANQV